jgi:hypothetical protein
MTWITVPPELVSREDEVEDHPGGFADWRTRLRSTWPAMTPPFNPSGQPPLPRPGDGTKEWEILWGENRRHGQLLEATTAALKALLGLEQEIDVDPSPGEAERRYRTGVETIAARHGAGLDNAARRRFRTDLEGVASARLPALVGRSRRRELDGWKASFEDSLVALRELALSSGSAEAERSILEQVLGRIDLAAGLGLVADATQGQAEFMAAYEAERDRRTAEAESAGVLSIDRARERVASEVAQVARPEEHHERPDSEQVRRRQSGPIVTEAIRHLPNIPDYREDVAAVNEDWIEFAGVARRIAGDDDGLRLRLLRRFAAEGGMRKDPTPGSSTFAGMTADAIAHIKKNFGGDPRVAALPERPTDLSIEQVALAYKLYPDVMLEKIGGEAVLIDAVGPVTADAIVDVLFHKGPSGGAGIVREAVKNTVPSTGKSLRGASGRIGESTLEAIKAAAAAGKLEELRANITKVRESVSHKSEHARIRHYRDDWSQ